MRILVKYPTRSRPELFLARLKEYVDGASRKDLIDILVSYDEDDVTMNDRVLSKARTIFPRISLVKGNSKTKIEAVNADINEYSNPWDIILVVSDDMILRRKGWDEVIRNEFKKQYLNLDGAIWFHDGSSQRKICTLSCMGRALYESFGYVYHPSYASFFCLSAETRIYMANQTVKPISEVRVGDVVVGTERRMPSGSRKKLGKMKLEYLCPATVTAIHSRVSDTVKIKTKSGVEVICTPDHVWARYPKGSSNYCPRKDEIEERNSTYQFSTPFVGMKMVNAIKFPDSAPEGMEREIGWLSGMMDGEGSFPVITQSIGHNPKTCAEIERIMKKLGINFVIKKTDPSKYGLSNKIINSYYISGGREEYLKFLDWVRPVKNDTNQVKKRMFAGRFGTPDPIVSIEPAGVRRVYCLTTTQGNFIAEGLLSHNCDDEFTEVCKRDGKVTFTEKIIAEHGHPSWGNKIPVDELYRINNKYWQSDKANYEKRKKLGFPK